MKQFQSSNGTIWNFPDSEEHFIMMLNHNPEYQIRAKNTILNHRHHFSFDSVLDIGANVGLWTRWFSKIGSKKIDCFEPMPENFECLKANTENLENIHLHNFALGNTNSNITLYTTIKNSNTGTATMYPEGDLKIPNEVQCKTLDSLDLNPTFIKMDIQGAELIALEGSIETLKRAKPGLIVECTNNNSSTFKFLESIGYELIAPAGKDYLLKHKN